MYELARIRLVADKMQRHLRTARGPCGRRRIQWGRSCTSGPYCKNDQYVDLYFHLLPHLVALERLERLVGARQRVVQVESRHLSAGCERT